MAEKSTETVAEIKRLVPEIDETRANLRTLREQLKDSIEQNEEYKKLKTEIDELATKRATAKKLLLADRDYQKINAEVEDYRFKLRDLEEILSSYLVEYYSETQSTEIVDDSGDTKTLIISAKLGKG